MVKRPVIFQVAGYQNSGKTTLVKRITEQLASRNFSIVTIKHHGHGGKPEMVESKDSTEHISAGAIASLVEGDGRIILQGEKESWTIEEQIDIVSQLHPDLILIEGHKYEGFPKAVIVRSAKDQELIEKLNNIRVVLYWDEDITGIKNSSNSLPFFNIHDHEGYEWICTYLTNQFNK